MNFLLEFSEEADLDVKDASDWYNAKKSGLGNEFLDNLESILSLIKDNPNLFAAKRKNYRIALLKRFPYKIIYRLIGNKIIIAGVLHHSRNPRLLKKRTGN